MLIILTGFFMGYKLMVFFLLKQFGIQRIRNDPNLNVFENSPIYHLMVLILVLSEVEWNMFDLSIWALVYLGANILRKTIFNVKMEKDGLIASYSYDSKVLNLLYKGKLLGLVFFFLGLLLVLGLPIVFMGVNIKVTLLLVFPLVMVSIDAIFLFLSSAAS